MSILFLLNLYFLFCLSYDPGNKITHILFKCVFPPVLPYMYRLMAALSISHNSNIRYFFHLCFSDFIAEFFIALIKLSPDTRFLHLPVHLFCAVPVCGV